MKRTARLLPVLVVVVLLLSACAVTSRNAILGKWNEANSGLTLEFIMDGRLRVNSQGQTVEMYYQFVNDQTVLLKGADTSQDTPAPFVIQGDQLTLDLGGQQMQLTRVR